MAESSFDSRPATRPNEIVFRGISPWKVCARFMFLTLVAAAVAWAFAGSIDFRTWLRVERRAAPWAAALSGGAATVFFVCAAWTWYSRIRWVAVSLDGLRWLRGARARYRRWDLFVAIHRGSIETTVWGEELKTGRYADIEFRRGRSLRISSQNVHGYEELLAEIQLKSAQSLRMSFSIQSGSRNGRSHPDAVAYGPLRIDPDGLEWDRKHYKWDEIEDYEVRVGYLRIQTAKGTEFVRRLTELGDWQSALERLNAKFEVGESLSSEEQLQAKPLAKLPAKSR